MVVVQVGPVAHVEDAARPRLVRPEAGGAEGAGHYREELVMSDETAHSANLGGPTADAFAHRLHALIASAVERRATEARDREVEMEQRVHLQLAFERLANRLHHGEIRPRMEAVARCFENARLEHLKSSVGTLSVCTLERTDRFPATTTLTVGVVFDPDRVAASVTYRLQIIPVLMEFEGQDALLVELDSPQVEQIVNWLEHRLERFAETYLRLERDPRYRAGTEHVDPVCGMRVTAASAVRLDRARHTFYFCAPTCRERFEADPGYYGDRSLALGAVVTGPAVAPG